ncbi:MAG: diguanylate cyclase [Gemmatimonadales bacterium]
MNQRPPHVMIVDDDEVLSRALVAVLGHEGFRTTTRISGEGLAEVLDRDPADLVILDLNLPQVDGLTVLEELKRHPVHADLPVLVLSAAAPDEVVPRALGLGAGDFVAKPFSAPELIARVKAQLRSGRALTEARAAARTGAELADILREITASLSPAEIYQVLVRRIAAGLRISRCSIVLDDLNNETATVVAAFENPQLRHLTVELKRYPELRGPLQTRDPLLITDVQTDATFASIRDRWKLEGRIVPTTSVAAIPFRVRESRGGIYFLRTVGDDDPLGPEDLSFARRVIDAASPVLDRAYDFEEALRRQDEMRHLAETDPLTGLFNRRAFRQRLESVMDRAERAGSVVSCLMLDLDHFKKLNDTYGHDLGDQVLVQLADLLRREQRAMDVLARLGGEEFVVLLPETGIRGARIYAERILRKVGSATFGNASSPVQLTVSIGIATYPDERVTDADSLLRLADVNLLRAKADGRNRYRD